MRRRIYTRGFARALPIGASIALLVPFLFAALLWRSDDAVLEYRLAVTIAFVFASALGAVISAARLPRHPDRREAARNGAIAALGAVGMAFLAAFLLSAVGPLALEARVVRELAPEFQRALLACALAAAFAGALTGRQRSRATTAAPVSQELSSGRT